MLLDLKKGLATKKIFKSNCFYSVSSNHYVILFITLVRPMFSSLIVPINGTAGNSVLMTCNSTGVPTPTITWLKDNLSLSPSPGKISISTADSLLPSGISSITSSLEIQGLVLSDTSNYSCKAVNDLARPQTEVSQEEELIILCGFILICYVLIITHLQHVISHNFLSPTPNFCLIHLLLLSSLSQSLTISACLCLCLCLSLSLSRSTFCLSTASIINS